MKDIFITENFLLQNDRAVELFHGYAKSLPIIDYHCHLPPLQVAEDQRFENLSRIWLTEDHYKWRAMRWAGVSEHYCTGNATDREKLQKWAETVRLAIRNPLYHWTHLELKRPFGISDRLFGPDTAESIWNECNEKLQQPEFSARGIMRQMNVALVCTTDDPVDSLDAHRAVAADASFPIQMLPTFRPEKAMAAVGLPETFNPWVERLAECSGVEIGDRFDGFLEALRRRHDYFHAMGCRLSDHGLETFYASDYTASEIAAAFRQLRGGTPLVGEAATAFRSAVLYEMALLNAEKGWTQQFHFGVMRNLNTRMFKAVGPDTGFDSMDDQPMARSMARFFDRLDRERRLAKTILYNLNPACNEMVVAMLGNFLDGETAGKIQYGSGWWYMDQKNGMERQLNTLSNLGLLSQFVGMLTDSRSFLSYTRHEYFRRILCNLLGTEMHQGIVPDDIELIGSMVRAICYGNAARYFGFNVPLLEELPS
ncbi:MAG: glucuronate isomerase [Thermoguttaceae bacterium]